MTTVAHPQTTQQDHWNKTQFCLSHSHLSLKVSKNDQISENNSYSDASTILVQLGVCFMNDFGIVIIEKSVSVSSV
jgi:hypothetical protein